MKKHILLITQYFHPESFRINDIAIEWIKRGYKVTVLTGIPNYPMGKFFDGYGFNKKRKELWNEVNIVRIPLIPRGNSENKIINAIGMILNYFSFLFSGFMWLRSKEAKNIKPDLVFTYEVSPMTQALIGIWYKRKYKVPSYIYVQDLWPENVEAITNIHNKFIIGLIDRMVDKIYNENDKIFTTSPSFVNAITKREKLIDKKKVYYWPQYAEDFYVPLKKQPIDEIDINDNSYKIAFTGNIGKAQGLDILPKVAYHLKQENIKFVIVGDGRYQKELNKLIDKLEVRDKFIMIKRLPANKIPIVLSAVDAGFISFSNQVLWSMTIPAKLQSYMACGKVIIASASGETKRIIEEANCGICCEIGNDKELADEIKLLLNKNQEEFSKNSKLYCDKFFNKNKLTDEMDNFLNQTVFS